MRIFSKALVKANHTLGQLNGAINLLPNPYVIFNAITLGEAKESSEIENIVTTFDGIFKEMSFAKTDPASKEVLNYRQAMLKGYELVRKRRRRCLPRIANKNKYAIM